MQRSNHLCDRTAKITDIKFTLKHFLRKLTNTHACTQQYLFKCIDKCLYSIFKFLATVFLRFQVCYFFSSFKLDTNVFVLTVNNCLFFPLLSCNQKTNLHLHNNGYSTLPFALSHLSFLLLSIPI